MIKTIVGLCALALGLLAAPSPRAQDDGGGYRLSLGYDGRMVVKVLDIQIEQKVDGQGFGSSARLISSGILRLLKNIDERASAQGRLEGGEAQPSEFQYQRVSSKTHRRVRTIWSDGAVETVSTPPFANMGDPPATTQQKLAAADPLTQLIRVSLARSRERICPAAYHFFDGKQLYAIELYDPRSTYLDDREKQLGLTSPFSCSARFREVAGFGKKDPRKHDQGMTRPMELSFARMAPSGPWVVSRLQAHTPIGSGNIELKRISTSGAPPG